MKKVAIVQSNYIPWKGYFDLIDKADIFIFHDDLQYTKNDWRNRNRIKTRNGIRWLTIPCGTNENRLICEVELKESRWQKKHWDIIQLNYRKSNFFHMYKEWFEWFYLDNTWKNLSDLNQFLVKKISKDFLEIHTLFEDSRKYNLRLKKAARVLELLKKVEAEEYISGPSAKDYLNEKTFAAEKIKLTWMDYSGYPEYTQLYPPFTHQVTILDLLFNEGPYARGFLKGS